MRKLGIRGRAALRSSFFLASLALSLTPAVAAPAREKAAPRRDEVVVWTYDSFVSEWGPAARVAEAFKAATGKTVRFVSQGDGGTLLAKVSSEASSGAADVVLGLDSNLLPRAAASGAFATYKPAGASALDPSLVVDPEFRLTAYDYGAFAVIYDSEKIPEPPRSLEDLCRPEYSGKLILMDPRTSTPGLGFLAWTKAVYGDGWKDYWKRLAPSVLTIAEGWDTGYGMFTSGEAPLVLSYTTSPAYHLEYESTERYKAAVFAEGHVAQVETAGLLAAAANPEGGKAFLDFMLTDGFQSVIPLTNWMYPATGAALPASFRLAPKPGRILPSAPPTDADLAEWARVASGRK